MSTYFAERVWDVSLRYDLGGIHPLVGRSAPDFELVDGTKLGELLKTGRGLFLDLDARSPLRAPGTSIGQVTTDRMKAATFEIGA
jgi:hypothetical protein